MFNLICTPSRSRLGSSKILNFSSGSKQCWCVFLRLLQVAVVVVVVHQPLPQTSPFLQVPLISSSNQTPLDPLLCSYARSWICCAPPCFTSVVVVVVVAVVLLCSNSLPQPNHRVVHNAVAKRSPATHQTVSALKQFQCHQHTAGQKNSANKPD